MRRISLLFLVTIHVIDGYSLPDHQGQFYNTQLLPNAYHGADTVGFADTYGKSSGLSSYDTDTFEHHDGASIVGNGAQQHAHIIDLTKEGGDSHTGLFGGSFISKGSHQDLEDSTDADSHISHPQTLGTNHDSTNYIPVSNFHASEALTSYDVGHGSVSNTAIGAGYKGISSTGTSGYETKFTPVLFNTDDAHTSGSDLTHRYSPLGVNNAINQQRLLRQNHFSKPY